MRPWQEGVSFNLRSHLTLKKEMRRVPSKKRNLVDIALGSDNDDILSKVD